jgi:hypothetical protein
MSSLGDAWRLSRTHWSDLVGYLRGARAGVPDHDVGETVHSRSHTG